jgi:hypothetical protein
MSTADPKVMLHPANFYSHHRDFLCHWHYYLGVSPRPARRPFLDLNQQSKQRKTI